MIWDETSVILEPSSKISSNLTILNTENLSHGIYLLSAGDNIKRKFIISK